MILLEKMRAKLQRLESELDALFASNPRNGHGGTPDITDNAKGRQMMRASEKLDERIRAKFAQIDEQKAKIEKMEARLARNNAQTKKSQKFLDKNPIHAGLFKLEEMGLVKQWAKNPQYFFIVGLDRVALATFNGEIHRCKRFPSKTTEETNRAEELISLANNTGRA
ncbi:hypothetical protein [Aggregatibacter kilianii]|uniref:hypothetical protein n=1 Tax=Aggregatibacter kilianii TaxID=2025884 RepID=UPI0013A64B10|nr:hypothetical protein [Aggregatibacter kilianii]